MYNLCQTHKRHAQLIELFNHTAYEPNMRQLGEIFAFLASDSSVEFMLVDSAMMQSINLQTRHISSPTDVLSLAIQQTAHDTLLGTAVINLEYAQKAAQQYDHTIDEEIALLFIHSILHLLGFDHESDQGLMRQKEQGLIEHFNLPNSLIVRTQEGL